MADLLTTDDLSLSLSSLRASVFSGRSQLRKPMAPQTTHTEHADGTPGLDAVIR